MAKDTVYAEDLETYKAYLQYLESHDLDYILQHLTEEGKHVFGISDKQVYGNPYYVPPTRSDLQRQLQRKRDNIKHIISDPMDTLHYNLPADTAKQMSWFGFHAPSKPNPFAPSQPPNNSNSSLTVQKLKDLLQKPVNTWTSSERIIGKAAYDAVRKSGNLNKFFSYDERISLSILNTKQAPTRHASYTTHAPDLPAIPTNKERQYTPEELTRFADIILEAEKRKKSLPKEKKKSKTPNTYPESNQFFGTGEGIGDLANALDEATGGASNYPGETLEQWLARKGKEAQKNMITPAKAKQAITNRINQYKASRKGTKVNESGRVMGPEVLHGTRYDPKNFNYGPVRNYLDIETVGTNLYKGSVLSYAVIKKAFNLDTGNWDIVSKRTRYYYPTAEDKLLTDPVTGEPVYDIATGISGLSNENIERRRKMQLAELGKKKEYAKHWTTNEFKRLLSYLGNDPVIGHNVTQFDWPKLILSLDPSKHLTEKDLPPGGLVDTLHLAEGTRGRGPNRNTLSVLYKLSTGHTPEQDGYTAHDALEDIQLTAIVHEHMLKSKSRMGKIARYLLHHPGLSTQFRDEMIKGVTEVLGMTPEGQDVLDNIVGDEGTIDDYIADLDFDGTKEVSRDVQLQGMGVPLGLDLELKELQDAITRLTAAIEGETKEGMASSSVVKQAAGLPTVAARKQFLHDALGLTGDLEAKEWDDKTKAAGYALNRANALYKARHGGRLEEEDKWKYGRIPGKWEPPPPSDLSGWGPGDGFKRGYKDPLAGTQWGNVIDVENLKRVNQAFMDVGQVLNKFASTVESVNSVFNAQAKGVYSASSYFIPRPLKEAGNRLFQSGLSAWDSYVYGRTKNIGLAGDALSTAGRMATGAIQGGIMGGGAGALIGGGIGLASGLIDTWGNYKKRGLMESGQGIISQIDIWSGFSELLLTPIRLAGAAFNLVTTRVKRFGNALFNVLGQMSQLGIPLTNLTSLSYADMQRSYVSDAMIGKNKGTYSSGLNDFANAQMMLYGMGQMNQERVIAAAMTGTFGSVYGYGGDTRKQYATTVNTIFIQMKSAPLSEKQRLMTLAGKIDPNMPTILQQMSNLSALNSRYQDYNYIHSEQWRRDRRIHQFTANPIERARYTEIGMEYTALTESMQNSKIKIAAGLWKALGKPLMDGVNVVLDRIANRDWRGAFQQIKKTAKGLWDGVKEILSEGGIDFNDLGNKIKQHFAGWVNAALPILGRLVSEYVRIVGEGWAKISEVVLPVIDDFITRLSLVRFSVEKDEEGNYHLAFKTLKDVDPTKAWSTITTSQKAQKWYADALVSGGGGSGWHDFFETGTFRANATAPLRTIQNMDEYDWAAAFDRYGPMKLKFGSNLYSISDFQSFKELQPVLESMRRYGINNFQTTTAGRAWNIARNEEIPEDELVLSGGLGLTKEKVGEMIRGTASAAAKDVDHLFNTIQIKFDLYEGTSDNPGKKTGSSTYNSNQDGRSSLIGNLHDLVRVTQNAIKEAM